MRQVTAILIGAGQRGAGAYGSYAVRFPNELKFIAVAEPRQDRQEEFAREHGISKENCFSDWKELLSRPRMADCVFICTQDKMHYEPLQRAMELGYHILCEKPITPEKEELLKVRKMAEEYDHMISIGHVLRFSPFFTQIKEIIQEGRIGRLINIQHMERVGYWHMAHSYVRGNWRSCEETSPMILAKCCHDFDILLYLIGKKCTHISSFGSLVHFRPENAPGKDVPERCTDFCEYREQCPYYAPRFYLENPAAKDNFRKVVCIDSENDRAVLEALMTGPYGRCVYRCDNDVVDHQIVNLQFEEGITASLTMTAFSQTCERVIHVQGSHGEISGWMDDNRIEVTDFISGNKTVIHLNASHEGHGGSDNSMMKNFVSMIAREDRSANLSGAVQAVDSHLMALAAEESRENQGRTISMEEYCRE